MNILRARPSVPSLAGLGLVLAFLVTCGGGTDANVGAVCESMAVLHSEDSYLSQVAKECSTGLCVKPIDHSPSRIVDTTSLCTAECSSDSDCEGELRSPSIPTDKRCITGFACMIPFAAGYKACQKLCICKDFLAGGLGTIPDECRH